MRNILSLAVLSLVTSCASTNTPHYRFWQGWKRQDIDYVRFRKELIGRFIPETVNVGAGKGLVAYMPVLLPGSDSSGERLVKTLPDEFALVVYDDEKVYRDLRETERGKKYGAMHWEIFDKERGSKSAIPEPYRGVAEAGNAYDMITGRSVPKPDWLNGTPVFVVTELTGNAVDYLDALRAKKGTWEIDIWLALVGTGYTIEWQLWRSEDAFREASRIIDPIRNSFGRHVFCGYLPGKSSLQRGVAVQFIEAQDNLKGCWSGARSSRRES